MHTTINNKTFLEHWNYFYGQFPERLHTISIKLYGKWFHETKFLYTNKKELIFSFGGDGIVIIPCENEARFSEEGILVVKDNNFIKIGFQFHIENAGIII